VLCSCYYLKLGFEVIENDSWNDSSDSSAINTKDRDEFSVLRRLNFQGQTFALHFFSLVNARIERDGERETGGFFFFLVGERQLNERVVDREMNELVVSLWL